MKQRTADPYLDLDVIDARAPRFLQATIGSLALVAFLTGWWPLLAILAAQLVVGLVFGRRYCLPCLAYFELVQARFGEGPVEDARPPRFSNTIGAVVLTAATVALAAGLDVLGWSLALLVAALALLAATTGVCVGCEAYRLIARLRGVRRLHVEQVDLAELGAVTGGGVVVQFTHPLCSDCVELERKLRDEGRDVVTVDVSERPELARKYGVAVVPTAFSVTADGTVSLRIAG
jgi:hypothetical protein